MWTTDGVVSIHLANVERYIKAAGLLNWGKNKYSGGSFYSTFPQFFWD